MAYLRLFLRELHCLVKCCCDCVLFDIEKHTYTKFRLDQRLSQ